MKRSLKIITTALLTLSLTATGVLSASAQSESRQITVSADGKVSVTPDAVRIYSSVSLVGQTSKGALESANAVSAKVRAAFIASGIDKKDIRTQSVTVYP